MIGRRFYALLIGISTALASCATTPPIANTTDNTIYGTQVAIGDCAFVKPAEQSAFSLVLGAIAASAISQGVNYLGDALTAAGASQTWTATADRNFEAKTTDFPKCVQIARGHFYTYPSADFFNSIPNWAKSTGNARSNWTEKSYGTLIKNNLWLSGPPDFFFEGKFQVSQDIQALTIEPALVLFQRPLNTRWLRPSASRRVALFFSIHSPGTNPSLATNPAATITLGELEPGKPITFITKDDSALSMKDKAVPYEAAWFTLSLTDKLKPLTMSVMVSETQDADDYMTFLGKVFSQQSTKDALNSALQQAVIPSVAAATEQTARQAEVANQNDADTKWAAAITSIKACAAATDAASAATTGAAALVAMRSANLAAEKAGARSGEIPFKEIDKLKLDGGMAVITSACKEFLPS